jgi:hypothetical protein
MFLFIDPPLRPSKEGNFRYSIFFNLLAIIVYRQTLFSNSRNWYSIKKIGLQVFMIIDFPKYLCDLHAQIVMN